MKLVKTASGKKSVKMSKREWQSIGKTAGWMKKASGSWSSELTPCDICKTELKNEESFYDAETDFGGQWALMCDKCFTQHGKGLGLGVGQKYDTKTRKKIAG